MRILYVAMKYDYGEESRGLSFEHHNFFDTLAHSGHEIIYFDFMGLMKSHSRWWMNRRLEEVAQAEKADLLFCVMYQEQLDRTTMRRIRARQWARTAGWFCDDHWRFDSYSRYWAPCFDLAVTTDWDALLKYNAMGYQNVLLSQWAVNPFTYRKLELPLIHDVTFVGQPHGNRRAIVEGLRQAGIPVRCWGHGWEGGRLSQEEMVQVFNQSRINLNLANSSVLAPNWKRTLMAKARDGASRALQQVPGGPRFKAWAKSVERIRRPAPRPLALDLDSSVVGPKDQIKGRNFEVPGCGGLLLTPKVAHLDDYYRPGQEIVTAETLGEMRDAIRSLLENEPHRISIANAGYQRTMQEHTYLHRFASIFQRLGLPAPISLEPRESTVIQVQ